METRKVEKAVGAGEPEGVTGEVADVTGEAAEQVPVGSAGGSEAAGRIRAARAEAEQRGAPMVSSLAMQAKLFDVYDDASAVPEALALVQRHLRLTLDRTWYSPQEVEDLADQLDWLLGLGPGETAAPDEGPDVDEPAPAAAG
jgi:hypothetical protein